MTPPRKPWCSQHGCHPSDCFDIHYPTASSKLVRTEDTAEAALLIHIERQNQRIQEESSRINENIVDARRKFEENKEKRRREA